MNFETLKLRFGQFASVYNIALQVKPEQKLPFSYVILPLQVFAKSKNNLK